MHPIFEPCTKRFKWRAGNNDGKWRAINVDDRLCLHEGKHNYIWDVKVDWAIEDHDDIPIEVYTGFLISADDYSCVWKQMCAFTDLNDPDYDDAEFNIELIGIDLSAAGSRVISTTYTDR